MPAKMLTSQVRLLTRIAKKRTHSQYGATPGRLHTAEVRNVSELKPATENVHVCV